MAGSGFDDDHYRFVDWGVVPCGLKEAMAVRIALRRSREDSAQPMAGSVQCESITSAHRTLGSSASRSSREPVHWSMSPTGTDVPADGKERMRVADAHMAPAEVADAAAHAAAEEAIRACVVKKRQWRNTHALTREQNQAVCAMVGLSPKEEKEDSDGSDISGDEEILLDTYRVFDCYFRKKDGKGARKGKDNHG